MAINLMSILEFYIILREGKFWTTRDPKCIFDDSKFFPPKGHENSFVLFVTVLLKLITSFLNEIDRKSTLFKIICPF